MRRKPTKRRIVVKLTPTQKRAKLVTAITALGYKPQSTCHEFGRAKAWLAKLAPKGKIGTCDECNDERVSIRYLDNDARCGNFCFRCVSRAPRSERAIKRDALEVARVIRAAGFWASTPRATHGGEWEVGGLGYRVVVNQESDTGNGGGIFIECVREVAPSHVFAHDGHAMGSV